MIRRICEIHLQVSNLEQSVEFYERLGMRLTSSSDTRRVAFFNIEEVGQPVQTFGIWENGKPIDIRHFAFEVNYDEIVRAGEWLAERGVETWAVFGRDGQEPIVHLSGPSASVYFLDPDGNELEFYCRLPGPSKGQFVHTPTLSEWESAQQI